MPFEQLESEVSNRMNEAPQIRMQAQQANGASELRARSVRGNATESTDVENDVGLSYAQMSELDENNVVVGLSASQQQQLLSFLRAGEHERGKECAITFEPIELNERIVKLPCRCGALFKHRAIEHWLSRSKRCPVCREDLSELHQPAHA